MANWTFLTHHAHVLLALSRDEDATIEAIAAEVGISTRATVTILNDLVAQDYIERERRGRRNHYTIHGEKALRHPSNASHTVAELISAISVLPGARS